MATYTNSVYVLGTLQEGHEVMLSPAVGTKWLVNHMAVSGSALLSGKVYCNVYVDDTFWCGSSAGMGDAADGTPIEVLNQQQLRFVWIPDTTYVPVFEDDHINLVASVIVTEMNA